MVLIENISTIIAIKINAIGGFMKKGLLLLGIMIAAISLVGCKNEKETSKKIDLSNNQTKINTSKSNDKIIPDTEDISDDYLNERYPGKEILHIYSSTIFTYIIFVFMFKFRNYFSLLKLRITYRTVFISCIAV